MFKADLDPRLKLEHNPAGVKAFLKGPFRYYAGLYCRCWEATRAETAAYPWVYFNSLNELDTQFMLLLSACSVDDPAEEAKVRAVSAGLDRMFSLLQLQGVYDSNEFASRIFDLSTDLRDQPASDIQ